MRIEFENLDAKENEPWVFGFGVTQFGVFISVWRWTLSVEFNE